MVETLVSSTAQTDPISRCTIYRLFSTAFKYPGPETYQEFRDGVFLAELFENMSSLYYMLPLLQERLGFADQIQAALQNVPYKSFVDAYTQTFDYGVTVPPCPPHEGLYRKGAERAELLLQLADFYEQFGLRVHPEAERPELPDHISVELEFLHFLSFKEAQARQQGAPEYLKGYVKAQADFLALHLNAWLPAFSTKLKESSRLTFFADVAGFAEHFALLDYEVLLAANGGSKEASVALTS